MFRKLSGILILAVFLLGVTACNASKEDASLGTADDLAPITKDEQGDNTSNEVQAPDSTELQESTTDNMESDNSNAKVNLNTLPIGGINSTAEYSWYNHLAEIQEQFILDYTLVFRGIKEDFSTPVTVYDDGGYMVDFYCETPIRVLEVFYGNVQVEDLITIQESLLVQENDEGEKVIFHEEGTPPLEKEEYIFTLRVYGDTAIDGTPVAYPYSAHYSFHKLSDYESFKQKVQDGTATGREIFGFEVMDYYLNDPDPALDLEEETIKMARLDKNATYEEALAALTEEQKELLHQMAERYGTK